MIDRFTFTAGDLASADFGSGHQVATLGHILHSEGMERSKTLLKKTFAALAPGDFDAMIDLGAVVVVLEIEDGEQDAGV